MKTLLIALAGFAALVLVVLVVFGAWGIGLNNQEVGLRATIEAKQKDNENELDGLKKKLLQSGQVTEKQAEVVKDIIVRYAEARTSPEQGKMMAWIKEAVPQVDTKTFQNLQNIVVSSRDAWVSRQKELLDLKRQHDVILRQFPGNVLFGMLGRKEITVTIVTSTEVKDAFRTGVDDNTDLFHGKK